MMKKFLYLNFLRDLKHVDSHIYLLLDIKATNSASDFLCVCVDCSLAASMYASQPESHWEINGAVYLILEFY